MKYRGRADTRHLSQFASGDVIIDNRGTLVFGDGCRLLGDHTPVELRTGPLGALTIGRRAVIHHGSAVHVARSVILGDDVEVGAYCVISDTEVGGLDRPAASAPAPIVIGERVWLAPRVVVRPGAEIGPGTIVTAASVVEGALPSDVLASGVPARVVRPLTPAELAR